MERMMDNETFDEVLNGFKEADSIVKKLKTRIAELEEENKKLKEQLERMKTDTMYDMKDINSLYEENKKLEQEISSLRIELEQEKGKTGKKWTPSTPYI